MNDVQLGDLIARMLISLVVVLGLIMIAYAVIKRRRNGAAMSPTRKPKLRQLAAAFGGGRGRGGGNAGATAVAPPDRAARGGSAKRGLQTVGRIGLSRTSSVVAVQFGQRVYLLGASETGAPTVLADIAVDAWLKALELPEVPAGPAGTTPAKGVVGIPLEAEGRPKLLDALREATTRRG